MLAALVCLVVGQDAVFPLKPDRTLAESFARTIDMIAKTGILEGRSVILSVSTGKEFTFTAGVEIEQHQTLVPLLKGSEGKLEYVSSEESVKRFLAKTPPDTKLARLTPKLINYTKTAISLVDPLTPAIRIRVFRAMDEPGRSCEVSVDLDCDRRLGSYGVGVTDGVARGPFRFCIDSVAFAQSRGGN